MRAEITDSKVKVVVGLGQTGLSCARYLSSRHESFKVIDTRPNPPGLQHLQAECPDVELELGEFKEETLLNAAQLIVSPGVDQQTPAIRKAVANQIANQAAVRQVLKHCLQKNEEHLERVLVQNHRLGSNVRVPGVVDFVRS